MPQLKPIEKIGTKKVYNYNDYEKINAWIVKYNADKNENIGYLSRARNDFQNKALVFLINSKEKATNSFCYVDKNNLIECSIYVAVQHIVPATWLNDRDQFLSPHLGWDLDIAFHRDCLCYSLFHSSNNISCRYGVNHFVPFSEREVGVRESYDSHFLLDFLSGKIKGENSGLYGNSITKIRTTSNQITTSKIRTTPTFANAKAKTTTPTAFGSHPSTGGELEKGGQSSPPVEGQQCNALRGGQIIFSSTAASVFTAGKELWRYYHLQKNTNPNASFYDIREHFQGRNDAGRMNSKSKDEQYNILMADLRAAMSALGKQIEPKIYEYGFLLE